ncbi:hypothetical protein [Limosilactobacillus fermentum]|uniref:hypothetical protein n=1 Tax=Limosilactobacillus fermentum TaxID=1613 RepID=UPI001E3D8364|nr:hypothetical protein [Limosilactobacillus fermentum]MCD5422987.1 hypothetical protein [Limosilactobacillus fermentum]
MASFVLTGNVEIDVSGLSEIVGEIRSVSISTLQGKIRQMAEQILRELAHADWPAGRVSTSYVSTGELADAVVVTGGSNTLNIRMDGSRMSMTPPGPGHFGTHMGVRGEAFNVEMPAYLNYGGGGIVPHAGSGYFEKAFGIYEEEFVHILAEALRGAGFEVSEG